MEKSGHVFIGAMPQEVGDGMNLKHNISNVQLQRNEGNMTNSSFMPSKKPSKRPVKKSNNKIKDEDNEETGESPPIKKSSKSKSGGSKKKKVTSKNNNQNQQLEAGAHGDNGPTSQFGRWKPEDDYALITAVQQTCDLTAVYLGIRFSTKFSLREIQERWYRLLYDPLISGLAKSAIQSLPPEVMSRIERETLFSQPEEAILSTVPSNNQFPPSSEVFDDLIRSNSSIFHPSRSPYILLRHWQRLRRYHMLAEQKGQPNHEADQPELLSDVEEELLTGSLPGNSSGNKADESLASYSSLALAHQRRRIRRLENESSLLNAIVEPIVGISPDFQNSQTLAVLRGRAVRYLMRGSDITIGRNSSHATSPEVDFDLSLEGPAWRVSRRQAVITMKPNGEFFIENVGRQSTAIIVDAKPLLPGAGQCRLQNNSVLEFGSCLQFSFLINPEVSHSQAPVLSTAGGSSQMPPGYQQFLSSPPSAQVSSLPAGATDNTPSAAQSSAGMALQHQPSGSNVITPNSTTNSLAAPSSGGSAAPPMIQSPQSRVGFPQHNPSTPANTPLSGGSGPGVPYPSSSMGNMHMFPQSLASPTVTTAGPHFIAGYRMVNAQPQQQPPQSQSSQPQQQQQQPAQPGAHFSQQHIKLQQQQHPH